MNESPIPLGSHPTGTHATYAVRDALTSVSGYAALLTRYLAAPSPDVARARETAAKLQDCIAHLAIILGEPSS